MTQVGDGDSSPSTLASLLEQLPEDLRRQAFTHASWVERRAASYERLAFLGDSVLSLAISTELYPRFAGWGAGRLTKLRAQAVSRQACAEVARDLGVPGRLREAGGAAHPAEPLLASDRVLASVCEAVIGAIYLSFGFDRTAPAIVEAFRAQIEEALANPVDFKSILQERLAQRGEVVVYEIVGETGPPHDRSFEAAATVDGEEIARGGGKTKKSAEQAAAQRALHRMDEDY